MLSGTNVALITDAGNARPYSDPGEVLVAECHKAGINRDFSFPGLRPVSRH